MTKDYTSFLSRLENAKGDFEWKIVHYGFCKNAIRGEKDKALYCPLEAIYIKENGEDGQPYKTMRTINNFSLVTDIMLAADGSKTKIREDILKVLGLNETKSS